MSDRTKAMIEQGEGRKLCDEALREIQLDRSTFDKELAKIRESKKSCSSKGDDRTCKHWTIAERLLKKAQADAKTVTQPPTDESIAL